MAYEDVRKLDEKLSVHLKNLLGLLETFNKRAEPMLYDLWYFSHRGTEGLPLNSLASCETSFITYNFG